MKKWEVARGAGFRRLHMALAIALLAMAPGASLGAETATVPLALGTGSELKLQGTSTMHDYESVTKQVGLRLTCDVGAEPTDAAALRKLIEDAGVRSLDVDIPVKTLRSEKSGLDKNMYKSLHEPEFPTITFHVTKVAVTRSTEDTLWLRAEGALTVAGKAQPKTHDARLIRGPDGQWLVGEQPLLMSEFGIRPPTMMMGALKVKDRVVIGYRLLLMSHDQGNRAVSGSK